jgi:hypothetical protein
VANNGQQQRFENERAAHPQDVRVEADVNYLREINNLLVVGGCPEKARTAEAQVVLLSGTAVGEAADELAQAVTALHDQPGAASEEIYKQKLQNFIELAQSELTGG